MVRRAKIEDAKGIATVHIEMWRCAYSGIVPQPYLDTLSVEKKAGVWERQIKDENSDIWVFFDENIVTGFIAGGLCRDEDLLGWNEIYAIYVSPRVQRSGIGALLTNTFLNHHKESCSLWVFSDNKSSIAFYRAMGFHPDGTEKEIQIDGVYLVEKRLVCES